jgi:hypothetical protein
MAMATEFAADVPESPLQKEARPIAAPPAKRPSYAAAGWIASAAFASIAVADAAWIGLIGLTRSTGTSAAPARIVVDSLQPGDAVLVDGREIGVTPLTLSLSPGVRSVRISARAPVHAAEMPTAAVIPAAERAANNSPTALVLAAARDRRGGLRIASPIELQVLEGERVLGSSADGPLVTTAGRHELDFVNSTLGYRSRQVVEIRAGQIIPMRISPPDGRVSVNAVPWAQVIINGSPVGETPLANVPLAVGEHEIVFRHPQLGEQTQKVIVKSNTVTRVSATFTR